jgi:hypothetical protein
LNIIAAIGIGRVEGVADPAGAQHLTLKAFAQPLLGQMVFQHHLTVTATQNAQRNRGGLDDVTAERFAFYQGLNTVDCRGNQALFETAHQQHDQGDAEQAEQQ